MMTMGKPAGMTEVALRLFEKAEAMPTGPRECLKAPRRHRGTELPAHLRGQKSADLEPAPRCPDTPYCEDGFGRPPAPQGAARCQIVPREEHGLGLPALEALRRYAFDQEAERLVLVVGSFDPPIMLEAERVGGRRDGEPRRRTRRSEQWVRGTGQPSTGTRPASGNQSG